MRITVLDADTLGLDADGWSALAELGELTLHPGTGHRVVQRTEPATPVGRDGREHPRLF